MNLFSPPKLIETEIFARLPDKFRHTNVATAWALANKRGKRVDSFIEGPSFDREGYLWITDIPFGRVLRVSPKGEFELIAEYDGWPNGLKIHRDGRIFIADYRNGLMLLDPRTGRVESIIAHFRSESFKGINDLVFASNGDLYFTDQGQTGLQDASGRVFRLDRQGRLACLIDSVPSPNGLVLNADETTLYVAVTRDNAVWRLPLMEDGGVSKVGAFIRLSGGLSGPDGLAMDVDDNLCICHAGFGAVWVHSRLGEPLYRIRSCAGLTTTNLAYGGPDNRHLYITESETGCILKAELSRPGRLMFSHAGDEAPR